MSLFQTNHFSGGLYECIAGSGPVRELKLLNLAEKTIESYISIVTKLSRSTGKPPLKLSRDDISAFILHELTVEKLAPRTINLQIGCFKTFYKLMSPGSEVMKNISSMKVPETLPVVLTESETTKMLQAAAWSASMRIRQPVGKQATNGSPPY